MGVMAGLLALPASAEAMTVRVAIRPGPLGITAASASAFRLPSGTGDGVTLTSALSPFTVTDATGTGAGWHVLMSASAWSTDPDDGAAVPMPAGSLVMDAPTVVAEGTSSGPPVMAPGPYVFEPGAGPVVIATALPEAGMGTYDFSAAPLTLHAPLGISDRTYGASVSVVVAAGP